MSAEVSTGDFSKRERQVVAVISRLGQATAREVERELPQAPTYSAVRSILRILTQKEVLVKERDAEGRDWYRMRATKVRKSIVKDFVRSFFADSTAAAACALLGGKDVKLTAEEAERLMALIREARK